MLGIECRASCLRGLEWYPQPTHNYFLTVESTPMRMFLKRWAPKHLEAGLGFGSVGTWSRASFGKERKEIETGEALWSLRGMSLSAGGSIILNWRTLMKYLSRSCCGAGAVQPTGRRFCPSHALELCRYCPQGGADSSLCLSVWPKDFAEDLSS